MIAPRTTDPSQLGLFATSHASVWSSHKACRIPSLLKWTGSKRSQAYTIAKLIPDHSRYFEPFLGSGAVLYLTARPGAIAGDQYAPLIDFWTLVQQHPAEIVHRYKTEWKLLQEDFPNHYYRVRKRFNRSPNASDLCFLTRTCVNGIVRFNAKGEFNNSLHLSRRGMQPSRFASAVEAWSNAVQGVRFICNDYRETLDGAKDGDFVYLDPPYAGTKQRYACGIDLSTFFEVLKSLNDKNVRWALSFDGRRGEEDLTFAVPEELFSRHLFLPSGTSPVGKVLNAAGDPVQESLYLNY